ncbi:hypothetical protein JTB14_019767 [Gonioctena quinquepunctata]|nr:hypothetical protein JTB14_019767 [Gonioctena quinquepunctata]
MRRPGANTEILRKLKEFTQIEAGRKKMSKKTGQIKAPRIRPGKIWNKFSHPEKRFGAKQHRRKPEGGEERDLKETRDQEKATSTETKKRKGKKKISFSEAEQE